MSRPSTNSTVMETLMRRHSKYMSPEIEPKYLFLAEWFGLHWSAGFSEDKHEIMEVLVSMVDAVIKDIEEEQGEVDKDSVNNTRAADSINKALGG